MKKMFLVVVCAAFLVSWTLLAQEAVEKGTIQWKNYGAENLKLEELTSIKTIIDSPDKFDSRQVHVTGKVSGVCKGSGCWVEIEDETGAKIIAKSQDRSIVMPKDCEGRKIEVIGLIKVISTDGSEKKECTKHMKEDAAKKEMKQYCPNPKIMLETQAIRLETLAEKS